MTYETMIKEYFFFVQDMSESQRREVFNSCTCGGGTMSFTQAVDFVTAKRFA